MDNALGCGWGVRIPNDAYVLSPEWANTSQAGVSTPVGVSIPVWNVMNGIGIPKGGTEMMLPKISSQIKTILSL